MLISSQSYGLSIDEAIKSTIENNPKVKIALEKINESKEILIYSKREKLPNITSSITGTYSNADTETATSSTTPETFTDEYKVTITKNLYDSGYTNLEIERSKVLYNNELINFKTTIQDLILDAINGYLTVINYEKSLEATKKNYDSVSKAYEEIKTRYELGSATLYDLQNAEASYNIAKTNLYSAEQNLKISKKTFQRIVNLKPTDLEDIINIESSINIDNVIEEAKSNNLNLLLISNEIKNKEILIHKEKQSKKPTLDISGTGLYSYGSRLDKGTETSSGSIALTLTIPLYQKGQDDSNIRKYQSQKLQEKINLEDSFDDLQISLLNTYKELMISKSKMESNLIVIKSIKTALISLKEEYQIGTKSITDLVEEEEKLLNANVNYLNSKRDYLLNYFKIKSLDGSLINIFDKYLPIIK
tara:strand:- start:1548 stop:2804 length:1257 start_codon:yes stop_codon:yes gene_type:complete